MSDQLEKTMDTAGYGKILESLFSDGIFEFFENLDDMNYAWHVGVSTDVMLQFKVSMGDEFSIEIVKYTILWHSSGSGCDRRIIFRGKLPATDNSEPDLDFVKKILANWKYIG